MSVEIRLSTGGATLVDEQDAWILAEHTWQAGHTGGGKLYVMTNGAPPKRARLFLHRVILGVTDPRISIDHVNDNGLDNRRVNIRICTAAENAQNRLRLAANNKSGYRGVWWDKGWRKWRAKARLNGRVYHLGAFDDVHEAGRAAAAFRAEHMPFSPDARAAIAAYRGVGEAK